MVTDNCVILLSLFSEQGAAMKTIGMIGGMSWESSLEYYRLLNEGVKSRLGGFHSAGIIMLSVDFAEIERLQRENRWKEQTEIMIDAARRLEGAGAEVLMICSNTMHKTADQVQEAAGIPLLHIADAAAEAVRARSIGRVGLLGTKFTMQQDFYRGRLSSMHGIDVIVPQESDMDFIHDVIYNELCLGIISEDSKKGYLDVIEKLITAGAEGIVLGCTEIPLLLGQKDVSVPVFDTTLIHADAAVRFALERR